MSYDRIMVLDAGRVIEFDTPLNLVNIEGGVFSGMCERSGITAQDIEKSVEEHKELIAKRKQEIVVVKEKV